MKSASDIAAKFIATHDPNTDSLRKFIEDLTLVIIAARTEMREAAALLVERNEGFKCAHDDLTGERDCRDMSAAIRSLNPEGEPQETVEAK